MIQQLQNIFIKMKTDRKSFLASKKGLPLSVEGRVWTVTPLFSFWILLRNMNKLGEYPPHHCPTPTSSVCGLITACHLTALCRTEEGWILAGGGIVETKDGPHMIFLSNVKAGYSLIHSMRRQNTHTLDKGAQMKQHIPGNMSCGFMLYWIARTFSLLTHLF